MKKTEKPKILIVDDRPENLLSLKIILENEPCIIIKALSGNEALSLMLDHDFALVLLDVQMPEMDGFETAVFMRGNARTSHVPIIFVTAINKEQRYIFKGYESGAVDYISKPLDPDILKNKINIFMDLYKQKKVIENKNIQLNAANKQILEQQKMIVEEERIKVLLQMAGVTTRELNQPLMSILGNIELLQKIGNIPKKLATHLFAIEESGRRISSILKRIQFIRNSWTKTCAGRGEPVDIQRTLNVLWMEDNDATFTVLHEMLRIKRTSCVTRARNIKEAKIFFSENNYNLAILELKLPDGNSFELLDFIRERKIKMPVLVLTGYGDEGIVARCIHSGAHGYLSKESIGVDKLHQGIDNAFEKFHLEREMEKAMKKMAEMATRDELTGLYNRRYMQEIFDRECTRSKRYQTDLSCLILDIDYFKQVNDTCGHICGDFVLREFSKLIEQYRRDSDYTFRYGGEEFMILLPHTDINSAYVVAEKIRKSCESKKFDFNDHTLHVTVSIGIASVNSQPERSRNMIAFADKALYQAKAEGRNCTRIYKNEKEAESLFPKVSA